MSRVSTETPGFTISSPTRCAHRHRHGAVLLAGLLHGALAIAAPQDLQALRKQAGEWLQHKAEHGYADTRAQVEMGPIDPRLALPACPAPTFALASGAHAWGRGSVEARCDEAPAWRLFISYQIHLNGPALLSRHALVAHAPIRADDVEAARIDYQQAPENYLHELPVSILAARPMAARQALTPDVLVLPPIIQAGREVQVVVAGQGFSLSQRGTALASAGFGQPVKVRIASGRIIQGVARRPGLVEVAP